MQALWINNNHSRSQLFTGHEKWDKCQHEVEQSLTHSDTHECRAFKCRTSCQISPGTFSLKNPRISRLLMLRLRLKRRKTHFSYKQPVHHLITAVTARSFTSRLSPPLCRSAVGQPSYWFIQPALAPQLKPTIYPYGPQSVPGRFLFKSKIGLLKQFCPLLNNKFSAV